MTWKLGLGLASVLHAQSQLDLSAGDPKKTLAAHRRQEEALGLYEEVYAAQHSIA
jgi:hypothetical protein